MLISISPAQCRAARALLNMTQPELAKAADFGLSTVVDFEKDRRRVSNEAMVALRTALELKGVEFLDGNGCGAGVRFRQRSAPHTKRAAQKR